MEKTFEEMIEEQESLSMSFLDKTEKEFIEKSAVLKLLKQVREATKKEDAEIADKYKSPHIAEAILNTSTDLILTDKLITLNYGLKNN